ncbi:MAG: type IV fimbrial biogenesis protein FimT [Cellvibrionaceae bacterium]|jgi:type IV fimbrial biogenesis protein FimT
MKRILRSDIVSQHQGFTIIELVVAIAIFSIAMTIGISSLSSLLANHRVKTAHNHLFSLIQYARMQAVSYRTPVLLCPSQNQVECTDNWDLPLMIFVDRNNDKDFNNDDLLLRVERPLADGKQSSLKGFIGNHSRYIRYIADGSVAAGRLTYCLYGKDTTYRRHISFSKNGRARKGSNTDKAVLDCNK